MSCFFCGSTEKTAEIRVLIKGEKKIFLLCALCAAERGIFLEKGTVRIDLDELIRIFPQHGELNSESVCPSCGTTKESVVFTGLAGCSECYINFREDLLPLFQVTEGSRSSRFEELFRKQGMRELLRQTEQELASCVAREDYEKASGLRDKIKELKEKLREPYEY
jgi:protein arginine kinase activator